MHLQQSHLHVHTRSNSSRVCGRGRAVLHGHVGTERDSRRRGRLRGPAFRPFPVVPALFLFAPARSHQDLARIPVRFLLYSFSRLIRCRGRVFSLISSFAVAFLLPTTITFPRRHRRHGAEGVRPTRRAFLGAPSALRSRSRRMLCNMIATRWTIVAPTDTSVAFSLLKLLIVARRGTEHCSRSYRVAALTQNIFC